MKTKRKRTKPIGIHLRGAKKKLIKPIYVDLLDTTKQIKPKAADIVPRGSTTGFNAHTGEVMYFPRVRAVYWGSAYGSQGTGLGPLGQALDNFFAATIPSVYFGFLAEYAVNMPTYFGSVWLPHDPTTAITVNESSMASTLISWLDGGRLPEVPGRTEKDLLYVIFLSPEMSIVTEPPSCGFHYAAQYHKGSGKNNLFYAVVGSSDLADLTSGASHELVEAFTDRSLNAWFSDDTGMEIGDVCSCCFTCPDLTLNGFALASYWRNSIGNCLQQNDLTPPTAKMSVNVNLVQRSGLLRTIDVTVTDSASKAPLAGATVQIQETGAPTGVTEPNGTVRLTYTRCVDTGNGGNGGKLGKPVEVPCDGTVTMPGFVDALFGTPT
jgi:hypothetical protein